MRQPGIITVAITGAVPKKKDNPAVPVTPTQQIESTHEAFEAGASLVHIHVRNPDESPGPTPSCTAGAGRRAQALPRDDRAVLHRRARARTEKRSAMLYLKPDMASLAPARSTSQTGIYENPPDFVEGLAKAMLDNGVKPEIEVFDLAMFYNAANLVKKGLSRTRRTCSS